MWRRGVGFLLVLFFLAPMGIRADGMSGYTTLMRVEFVLECMREHPGTQYEMMSKCSCVLDQLAKKYSGEAFVEARTMAQAISIAGERGSALRDNEEAHKQARAYREALAMAETDCFLRPSAIEEQN